MAPIDEVTSAIGGMLTSPGNDRARRAEAATQRRRNLLDCRESAEKAKSPLRRKVAAKAQSRPGQVGSQGQGQQGCEAAAESRRQGDKGEGRAEIAKKDAQGPRNTPLESRPEVDETRDKSRK